MSAMSKPLSWGAGLLCGVVFATSVSAQAPKRAAKAKRNGQVHQMEVYDGTRRTVRYFGDNISPGESSTLRDLERAQNEMAYLNDLQALKDQYVVSERLLEPHRRMVQRDLYGRELTKTSYGSLSTGYFGNYTAGGYFNYPWAYMGGFGGVASAVAGDSRTETFSLATGVGPESRLKEAM